MREKTQFQTALESLVASERFNGVSREFSRATGIADADVCRFLSGERFPTREKMSAIIKGLERRPALELLLAYLNDVMPTGGEELVSFKGHRRARPFVASKN